MTKTKIKTNIFHKGEFVRSEGLVTLSEWISNDRLEPGQHISVSDINEKEGSMFNHESFYVGNCTPYMMPSNNDGGIGWDFDDPMMEKYVTEVNTF
jgi:hypothetical protein